MDSTFKGSRSSNSTPASIKDLNFAFDLGGTHGGLKGHSLANLKEIKQSTSPSPTPVNPAHRPAAAGSSPTWKYSPSPSIPSSTKAAPSWSMDPVAQAGIVGSVSANDSLADLWKSTASMAAAKSPPLAQNVSPIHPRAPSLAQPQKYASMEATTPISTPQQRQKADLFEFDFGSGPMPVQPEIPPPTAEFGGFQNGLASADPFDFLSTQSKSASTPAPAMDPFDSLNVKFQGVDISPDPQQSAGFGADFGGFQEGSGAKDPFGAFTSDWDPFSSFPAVLAPSQAQSQPQAEQSDPFDSFFGQNQTASKPFDPMESIFGAAVPQKAQSSRVDPLDTLLEPSLPTKGQSSSSPSADGWGVFNEDPGGGWGSSGTEFPAGEETTTELKDVGSAPVGVTPEMALKRGSEFFKGGQYADAIKWLMWAEQLSGQGSGSAGVLTEALTTRSKCYKESGEMNLAIADCTKLIEMLPGNTVALMNRARLYEATEKYKLGVADLRKVNQLDPANRQAVSMLARLNKAMAA